MRIYLDTCALNRPTDDMRQARIRLEAKAIAQIFDHVVTGRLHLVGSSVLRFEIDQNPFVTKRLAALKLLSFATEHILPTPETFHEAARLSNIGLGTSDALHLATACQAGVQAFLTTDDRLIQRVGRSALQLPIVVMNPVDWLQRRFLWLLPRP